MKRDNEELKLAREYWDSIACEALADETPEARQERLLDERDQKTLVKLQDSPWERAQREALIDNAFAGATVDAFANDWDEQ